MSHQPIVSFPDDENQLQSDLFNSGAAEVDGGVTGISHEATESGVESVQEDGRDLLEALIFASDEPLDTQRLASLLERSPDEILDLVAELNKDYLQQRRAFELVQLAGGWQLAARRRYGTLLRRLLKERVRPRLSRAALETLAVVAYRQPVTKGDIESIRGVQAEAVLRTLLERRLIMIAGRSEAVGRPLLYRTTREFLEAFALNSLQDLPRLKEAQEWLRGGRDRGKEELPPQQLHTLSPPTFLPDEVSP